MNQEEFYSFLAMFDIKIAEKYKQNIETDVECEYCNEEEEFDNV